MEISAYAMVFRHRIIVHRVTHHPSVLVLPTGINVQLDWLNDLGVSLTVLQEVIQNLSAAYNKYNNLRQYIWK